MLYYKKEVMKKILSGASKVYNGVKHTLGPNNCSSVICQDNDLIIVDDGYTIANSINLSDKVENIGAKLLINAASEMESEIGDGTTSTIIIAYSLLKSILGIKKSGRKINRVIEEVEKIKEKFFHELDKNVKPVDNNILERVFFTSTNDSYLTSLIGNAINNIGVKGIFDVCENNNEETVVEIEKGYFYDHGYYDESIFEFKSSVDIVSPYIIIDEDLTINYFEKLEKIIDDIQKASLTNDILLIVNSLSKELIREIVLNNIKKNNKIFVIILDRNNDTRRDLFNLTGYNPLKYGSCKRVIINKNKTKFYFDDNIVEKYLLQLERELKEEKNEYHSFQIKKKLANLKNGSALIKIGGKSELEVKLKKMKVLDGLKAIEVAKKTGVIFGGGREILIILKRIKFTTLGEKIFRKALLSPILCLNANSEIKKKIKRRIFDFCDEKSFDYNKMMFVDEKEGIYDPVMSLKKSINIAVSITKMLAKIDSIVINNVNRDTSFEEKMFDF